MMLDKSAVASMRRLSEEDRRDGCYSEPIVVIALCDEIDAMRPVVEAVAEWVAARPADSAALRLAVAYAAYYTHKEGDDGTH